MLWKLICSRREPDCGKLIASSVTKFALSPTMKHCLLKSGYRLGIGGGEGRHTVRRRWGGEERGGREMGKGGGVK